MVPIGVVVHHDPDDAETVFHRRGEHRRVLPEPAVADQRHDGPVGGGQLGADGRGRAEPHGREPPWREDRARRADRELLADAVLVPSDVGRDVRIVGQHAARLGEDPLRHHREGGAGRHRCVAGGERRPSLGDAPNRLGVGEAVRMTLARDAIEHLERGPRVGDGPDLGRERAADLAGLDVDVDQRGVGDVEREVAVPRTAVGFFEARADGEDDVGREAGVVDELGPPEPGHAEHHRVVVTERALAHQTVGDGDAHVLDEALQLVTGSRQQHTATGVDDRASGLGEAGDDGVRRLLVERGLVQRLRPVVESGEERRVDGL